MKKKYLAGLATGLMVFGLAGGAGATLTTVGTAFYDSDGGIDTTGNYNLIYDADNPFGPITWLDYSRVNTTWQNQVNWASGLGASLTVSLLPGYTTSNVWTTGWRLPSTVDGYWVWSRLGTTPAGYNITSSEMGHLYYTELVNKGEYDTSGNYQPDFGLKNKGPFDNLIASRYYWSGTEYAPGGPIDAWFFSTGGGYQTVYGKNTPYLALAVRPGQVTYTDPNPPSTDPVPEPATMLLFGMGLAGLAGTRLRRKKK